MNVSGISSGSLSLGSSISVNANNTNATVSPSQFGGPFASLNLSSTQQQQISQILQNARSQGLSPQQVQSQINAVLTPAQQQQLQSQMSQHHHHHQTDAFGIPTQLSSGSSGAQTIGDIAAAAWAQSQQQTNS